MNFEDQEHEFLFVSNNWNLLGPDTLLEQKWIRDGYLTRDIEPHDGVSIKHFSGPIAWTPYQGSID